MTDKTSNGVVNNSVWRIYRFLFNSCAWCRAWKIALQSKLNKQLIST